MTRLWQLSHLLPLLIVAALLAPTRATNAGYVTLDGAPLTQGQLRVAEDDAKRIVTPKQNVQRLSPNTSLFVLEKTKVDVEISGVLARVRMEQVFSNPYSERLEAIYVFPLPEDAAVDAYAIQVGETVIEGVVKKREEARREYESARREGRKGGLLEQERPNVFTQSVANIAPKEKVSVRIEYVHPVKMDGSRHSFRFPMVVAPRYVPGQSTGNPNLGRGWAKDSDQVPDASRVTPHVLPPGKRLGNDVFIAMRIDGGVPIQKVTPVTHEIEVERPSETAAVVKLRNGPTIANKDFVLEYSLAGEQIALASLTHRGKDAEHGYVTLVLQPKRDVATIDTVPREVIFLLDTSGSMGGPSIGQLRILADEILASLEKHDTFRLVSFSNTARSLDSRALAATPENIARGQEFIRGLRAGGGTNLLPALKAALGQKTPEDAQPRYLVLITDALVGNDSTILAYLRHDFFKSIRVFPIAVGAAPNHYLIERAAEIGRGFAMTVTNQDNALEMAKRFRKKTSAPILTDLRIDWGGLEVTDVAPSPLPDLHAGEPLVVMGRYSKPGKSEILLRGNLSGGAVSSRLELELPEKELSHDSLAPLWARGQIRRIWNRNVGKETEESRNEITRLGLEHQLVTQYTSFVAVEKTASVDPHSKLRSEQVRVVLPEGMTRDAAPPHAFSPNHSRTSTPPAPAAQAPTGPSNPATASPPKGRSTTRSQRGDRGGGFRLPRMGGGAVEWVFLGSLALLGAGSAASRRRRREDG